MRERRSVRSCATSPVDRVVRGLAAVFVGAFSLSLVEQPWCAIPAGICATLLAVGAITGWCPTELFADRGEPNTLGYAEARQNIDIRS